MQLVFLLPLIQNVTLSEEEKTKLAVDGECQAILDEQCPAEYNDVREEDVSAQYQHCC